MSRIGTMQGRLSPPEGGLIQFFPRERWREEFALAREAGFDQIEWLYDTWGEEFNPIATDEGVAAIQSLCRQTGVAVYSLCAHYFVEHPFVKSQGAELAGLVNKLEWLVARCAMAGIQRVVVPFLDEGGIRTAGDEQCAIDVLHAVLPAARRHQVELHLEMGLGPDAYARFLEKVEAPPIRVLYDTGNSTSFGFDAGEELAAYGAQVASVHIKDRIRGGGSVPLGTGDANLAARLAAILASGYGGDFVLEAARGEAGDELAWAKRNLAVVREQLAAATSMAGGLPSK